MMRTIAALAGLSFFTACSGGSGESSEVRRAGESTGALTEFHPAFIDQGAPAESCVAVEGAGGTWEVMHGTWNLCRVGQGLTPGCAYSWASTDDGAPADVDALAAALGPAVRELAALHGRAVSTAASCPILQRPNPGSTPCGACEVGLATATHLYLAFATPYPEATTLHLRPDAMATSSSLVTVQVPANVTTYDEARDMPASFAGGVVLSLPHERGL